MHSTIIPDKIQLIFAIFYELGIWCKDETTSGKGQGQKLIYLMYLCVFTIAMTLGAYNTTDKDERVFSTIVLITAVVQIYRLWYILWQKNEIIQLIHEAGTHCTNDRKGVWHVDAKMKMMMKFISLFLLMILFDFVSLNVFPFASGRLFFNIAFPLDQTASRTAFWIEFLYIAGACLVACSSSFLIPLVWYVMLSYALKYDKLGKELSNMGVIRKEESDCEPQLKTSTKKQQQLYQKDLIMAIKSYEKINGYQN